MAEPLSIDGANVLPPAQDYNFLRNEAIQLIEKLSGKVWTDYNTHDPGITLLETLCYTLTDLGYRASFDIRDIIASSPGGTAGQQDTFYTAARILPCNPVTLNDYRKLIIDTDGVRNAWIEISDDYEVMIYLEENEDDDKPDERTYKLTYDARHGEEVLRLRGLYKVFVEYEADVIREKREEEVAAVIRSKLNIHRNLCEDVVNITSIEYEYFQIEAVLQVSEGSDIEMINARVYEAIYNYFSPPIPFYSLEQMLEKGYSPEQIFEGPILKHGFIDDGELEKAEKYKDIHLSDIMSLISGIEGVIAIKKFALPVESQSPFSDFTEWIDNLKDRQKAPRLDIDNSVVHFVRSGDRHRAPSEKEPNKMRVNAIFLFLQSGKFQSRLKGSATDFSVPVGEDMSIAEYFPMQRTLPAIYGMEDSYIDENTDEDTLKDVIREYNQKRRDLEAAQKAGRYPQIYISDRTRTLGNVIARVTQTSLAELSGEEELSEEQLAEIRGEYKKTQIDRLESRKKQTLQLRGFLMVFEQILADYLSQLSNTARIFSLDELLQQTYFPADLEGIRDFRALFIDFDKYRETQLKITETESGFVRKRNVILDHLIARFSESLEKYSFYMHSAFGNQAGQRLIIDKINFLRDYIKVSNLRGTGFDYSSNEKAWDSENVEGFKRRICRLLGISDYSRRAIATDSIGIRKVELDNGIVRYVVVFTDPEDPSVELLRSIEYEFESEAREILNYILENGSRKDLYVKEGRKDRASYNLRKGTSEDDFELVAGGQFSKDKSDAYHRKTMDALGKITANENFHVIEHILLRPKVSPRERTSRKQSSMVDADVVDLLPVPDISDKAGIIRKRRQHASYKFKITNVKDTTHKDRTLWKVRLLKDDNTEVLLIEEEFVFYRHLTRRMEYIKEFASDRSNYSVGQNADGFFNFTIVDDERPLAVSKRNYRVQDEMEAEIANMVKFFSFDLGLIGPGAEKEDDITYFADPYSFQVSIFIPTWPTRFRDPTFRHLLEKTIYMELPAHIYAEVYWLDHIQMKQFEEAYRLWVEELAETETPNTEVVNNMIYVLNEMRNSS